MAKKKSDIAAEAPAALSRGELAEHLIDLATALGEPVPDVTTK